MKKCYLMMAVLAMFFVSCGGSHKQSNLAEGASGDMDAYTNSAVNGVEQARPSIMVIPSDRTLQNFQCLQQEKHGGVGYVIRDYQSYVLADQRCKLIYSFIQDKFNDQNYPLNDFEQTLKQLNTMAATDIADGLQQDAKTQLLLTARPDIILELDYASSEDGTKGGGLTSHDYGKSKKEGPVKLSYTLSAIDAYNNKVVATISGSDLEGSSTTEAIQGDMEKKMKGMMNDIQKYFSDILTRGRDVTLRINVDKDSNVKLTDESIEGDTYSDWIVDYIKAHTVKGAYKMNVNTDYELSFTNVRIPILNEDGTQYGVYDFARDLQKNLRQNLGLKCTNRSEGLGEIVLTVKQL